MSGRIRDPRLELLITLLGEAFEKRSWHGPNLRGTLRGVPAAQAAWRAAPGRHNIWELAVHAAYWKYAVRRKLTGEKRGAFALAGSNWFARPAGDPDEKAWKRDLALLTAEHRALCDALEGAFPAILGDPLKLRLIRGAAAHDLYHAGQIQILKRLYQAR